MNGGFVYLVGAGPGDPRLLTLRAFELLRSAEVVAHDELVSAAILALAADDSELLRVGHRGGRGRIVSALHPLVLERARAGKKVVRLKCGDPMVFGRGGEEAEELQRAGIPFEIVPGISAALGAAAYCGIPLTDRRYASRVTLATGHSGEAKGRRRETLVLYMALRKLRENLDALIASGWDASTPAAYISSATTAAQQSVIGTIGDLAARVAESGGSGPSLVMVGEVVKLRQRARTEHVQPLRGRQILIARARPGRSRIAAELRMLGASVTEAPNVRVQELPQASSIADVIAATGSFDALVFGCAEGVEVASRRNVLADLISNSQIIVVGRQAAGALAQRRITPSLVLEGACANEIRNHKTKLQGKRLILIGGERGRPSLEAELAAVGALVKPVAIYRHEASFPELVPCPDLLVLPSSSAAKLIFQSDSAQLLRSLPAVAIGEQTRKKAELLGARRIVQSAQDSIDSLVEAVVNTLAAGSARGFVLSDSGEGRDI